MKAKNITLTAVFVLASTASALANSGTSNGEVQRVYIHTPNVLMFKIGGGISSAPTCASQQEWAISLDDPIAKPMLAILLSAQNQGKSVYVQGNTNACLGEWQREIPSQLSTN